MTQEEIQLLLLQEQARARAAAASDGRVIATTPDGGRVIEKDGTRSFTSPGFSTSDPDTIARIMEGATPAEEVQRSTDQMVLADNPVAARANEFVRGVPFVGSYADEAVGLLSPKARDGMRAMTGAMQRERPGQTAALNMGGAVVGSVPIALAAAPSVMAAAPASTGGRMLGGGILGMLGGGIEGAVYGQGEGTGEFMSPDRQSEAGMQGAFGAAAGGVGGALLPAAGGFIEGLIRRYRGEDIGAIAAEFGVSRDAARILKRAFEQNDAQAVDRIIRAGSEATMADAGRSGQALLDAAAQTGGRPLNIVDSAVTSRANRSNQTVTGALDSSLGPVTGPRAAAREVAEASRPARTAAYQTAYLTPIDYTTGNQAGARVLEVMDALPPRIRTQMASQMDDAIRLARLRGEPVPDAPLFNAQGERIGSMPTVMQLDFAKKALDQIVRANTDEFGRVLPDGVTASGFVREVRDATIDATGGQDGPYAAALRVGRDKIELDEGLRFGLRMLRNTDQTTREMVAEVVNGMSADGREMMKRGLRSYIDEVMAATRVAASDLDGQEGREAMQALRQLGTTASRDKLRILLGPEEFGRIMPKLDEALASQGMKASVAQNSRTAIRQSLQNEAADIVAPGIGGRIARGQPVDATQSLVQELLATTPGDDAARLEGIWSDVARVLSEQRGSRSAQAALQYVENAINGSQLSEAQVRLIANQFLIGAGAAGSRTAGQARAISENAQ